MFWTLWSSLARFHAAPLPLCRSDSLCSRSTGSSLGLVLHEHSSPKDGEGVLYVHALFQTPKKCPPRYICHVPQEWHEGTWAPSSALRSSNQHLQKEDWIILKSCAKDLHLFVFPILTPWARPFVKAQLLQFHWWNCVSNNIFSRT